jgi:hypothetical protein
MLLIRISPLSLCRHVKIKKKKNYKIILPLNFFLFFGIKTVTALKLNPQHFWPVKGILWYFATKITFTFWYLGLKRHFYCGLMHFSWLIFLGFHSFPAKLMRVAASNHCKASLSTKLTLRVGQDLIPSYTCLNKK